MGDLEFIIPCDRFERVARAEVSGLIVKPVDLPITDTFIILSLQSDIYQ